MLEHSTEVKVRFAETDAMGIVYHANYLAWCECARVALLENIGVKYENIIARGIHLPVVEATLRYKYPARFGDLVKITARIKEKPQVRIKIEYTITVGGKLAVEGHTLHVFINDKGVPVKPPKDFLETLGKYFE